MSIKEAFETCPSFDRFHEDEIDEIASCSALKTFSPGNTLYNKGERAKKIYVVAKGVVVIEQDFEHDVRSVYSVSEGEMVGGVSAIGNEQRIATARIPSGNDVTLVEIDADDLRTSMKENGSLAVKLFESVAGNAAARLRNSVDIMGSMF